MQTIKLNDGLAVRRRQAIPAASTGMFRTAGAHTTTCMYAPRRQAFYGGSSARSAPPTTREKSVNPVEKESRTLVIECLPDFALWPGMKLRFEVKVNGGETIICEVPRSDANINEGDSLRHAAVQDGFIRIEVHVTFVQGENTLTIAAIDPGVAIDRIGVR